MYIPFRLYFQRGCPHCEQAMEKLQGTPVQMIEVGNDPILQQGLSGFDHIIPLLVSFKTQEVITGFKENEYARLIEGYHSGARAVASSGDSTQGVDLREAPVGAI